MNIAFIAHDGKKRLMENLCIAYRHILSKHAIYATGTTGQIIEEATNLPVHKYLAGHLGGEHQLGAQIVQDDIDLLIFLREPIVQRYDERDIDSVMRLCDVHNIPLASNLATAEVLLLALERGDLDWRNVIKK